MAGFHLTRDDETIDTRIAAARARFVSHGFSRFTPVAVPGYRGFHVGYIHGGPDTILHAGEDLIVVAGTLTYDGLIGRPALARLLAEFTFPFTDWARLSGQFVLLVRKGGRAFVLNDFFGSFQLFHDPAHTTLSTSFLATAEAQPRLNWHAQAVYEFAFNVFPLGNDTVFTNVARLGPYAQLELTADGVTEHPVSKALPDHTSDIPIEERIQRNSDVLNAVVMPFVEAFGDAMQCPLSGGLDSRLALALLRAHGVRPHVYVYGEPDDEDVQVARAIGAKEGFAVELFNKPNFAQITPDQFSEIVQRNFDETDALVTDGGLFDNGGNAHARHARNANGQLAVSGGCGEVFRNFFYLPDRALKVRDVAQSFFARFVASDATDRFDPRAFLATIEAKLARSLGRRPDDRLSRTEAEQLYPRERCRVFFGREISLVGRHGAYLMPFLHRSVVSEAVQIPMDLKRAGRFEAMLLNRIDPALARHMSAYGHNFAEPPSRAHVRDEWQTIMRPPWARRRSYAVRRMINRRTRDEHGGLLSPIFLGRIIDLHFPAMQRFFRPERVAQDSGLYRRVATLEYLAGQLGSRIEDE